MSVNFYDADRELNVIREWYKMVRTPLDETTSMKQLEDEAKNNTGKPRTRMNEYLRRAMDSNRSMTGLTRPECLVVMMYTDDSSNRAFFAEYNKASIIGNWQPYAVYTTLLMSALEKLAKNDPIPKDKPLYRGLSCQLKPPTASRIFWKAMTSTTLDIKVAERIAAPDGIILEFHPPASGERASRCGARVRELSSFEENEVILLPFEAFDFLGAGDRKFHFKTSKTQNLLT